VKTEWKGPARLTIVRSNDCDGRLGAKFYLEDQVSGTRLFEVSMTAEAFAVAVLGLGRQSCEVDAHVACLGMKREHKTLPVPFESKYGPREVEAQRRRDALVPYEADGWRGSDGDLANHHNRCADGCYNVLFERWVDPETGEP